MIFIRLFILINKYFLIFKLKKKKKIYIENFYLFGTFIFFYNFEFEIDFFYMKYCLILIWLIFIFISK